MQNMTLGHTRTNKKVGGVGKRGEMGPLSTKTRNMSSSRSKKTKHRTFQRTFRSFFAFDTLLLQACISPRTLQPLVARDKLLSLFLPCTSRALIIRNSPHQSPSASPP